MTFTSPSPVVSFVVLLSRSRAPDVSATAVVETKLPSMFGASVAGRQEVGQTPQPVASAAMQSVVALSPMNSRRCSADGRICSAGTSAAYTGVRTESVAVHYQ